MPAKRPRKDSREQQPRVQSANSSPQRKVSDKIYEPQPQRACIFIILSCHLDTPVASHIRSNSFDGATSRPPHFGHALPAHPSPSSSAPIYGHYFGPAPSTHSHQHDNHQTRERGHPYFSSPKRHTSAQFSSLSYQRPPSPIKRHTAPQLSYRPSPRPEEPQQVAFERHSISALFKEKTRLTGFPLLIYYVGQGPQINTTKDVHYYHPQGGMTTKSPIHLADAFNFPATVSSPYETGMTLERSEGSLTLTALKSPGDESNVVHSHSIVEAKQGARTAGSSVEDKFSGGVEELVEQVASSAEDALVEGVE
jgi:hypothetical protein